MCLCVPAWQHSHRCDGAFLSHRHGLRLSAWSLQMWGLLHTAGTLVKKMVLCGRWLKDKRWGNGRSSTTTRLCTSAGWSDDASQWQLQDLVALCDISWCYKDSQCPACLQISSDCQIFQGRSFYEIEMKYLPGVDHLKSSEECIDVWRPTGFVGLNVFALSNGWVQISAETDQLQGRAWAGTQVSVQAAQTYCH